MDIPKALAYFKSASRMVTISLPIGISQWGAYRRASIWCVSTSRMAGLVCNDQGLEFMLLNHSRYGQLFYGTLLARVSLAEFTTAIGNAMKIIRYLNALPFKACVAAIGNFDGIHLGHQTILAAAKAFASQQQLPCVVVTFEPQPSEFFNPTNAPARLTNFREKMTYFAHLGIDIVCCNRFNSEFANLTPQQFIQEYFVKGLKIKALFVGENFYFGKQRQGSILTLREFASHYNFDLYSLPLESYQEEYISSTRIRSALKAAQFELVAALLGRVYRFTGRVSHGAKRGQYLGFPTANMRLHRLISPLQGVFAVRVHGLDKLYYGVANIGNRPTVDGTTWWIETHILDFKQTIYGRLIHIEPLCQLRPEKKFASIEMLVAQIHHDIAAARAFFA